MKKRIQDNARRLFGVESPDAITLSVRKRMKELGLYISSKSNTRHFLQLQQELDKRNVSDHFFELDNAIKNYFTILIPAIRNQLSQELEKEKTKLRSSIADLRRNLVSEQQLAGLEIYESSQDESAEDIELLKKKAIKDINNELWNLVRLIDSTQRKYIAAQRAAQREISAEKYTHKGYKLTYLLNAIVFVVGVILTAYIGIILIVDHNHQYKSTRTLKAVGDQGLILLSLWAAILLAFISERYKLELKQTSSSKSTLFESHAAVNTTKEKLLNIKSLQSELNEISNKPNKVK